MRRRGLKSFRLYLSKWQMWEQWSLLHSHKDPRTIIIIWLWMDSSFLLSLQVFQKYSYFLTLLNRARNWNRWNFYSWIYIICVSESAKYFFFYANNTELCPWVGTQSNYVSLQVQPDVWILIEFSKKLFFGKLLKRCQVARWPLVISCSHVLHRFSHVAAEVWLTGVIVLLESNLSQQFSTLEHFFC